MIDKLKMQDLTAQEARENLTEDAVILLPMGSLEDQGMHVPMGDYITAEAVAMNMAHRLSWRRSSRSAARITSIPATTASRFACPR